MNLVHGRFEMTQGSIATFVGERFKWDVPINQTTQQVGLKDVSNLVLGIRSEHIELCQPADSAKTGVAMVNEVLENRGDVSIVHLEVNDDHQDDQPKRSDNDDSVELIVRAPSDTTLKEGQLVGFRFDPVAVHWFDEATGENLLKE